MPRLGPHPEPDAPDPGQALALLPGGLHRTGARRPLSSGGGRGAARCSGARNGACGRCRPSGERLLPRVPVAAGPWALTPGSPAPNAGRGGPAPPRHLRGRCLFKRSDVSAAQPWQRPVTLAGSMREGEELLPPRPSAMEAAAAR